MQATMDISTRLLDPVLASSTPDESSVNEFLAQVDSQLNQGASLIQIDCSPLDRISSSIISALWLAREKCSRQGAAIELLNVGNGLRRVLEAIDLAGFFLPETTIPLRFDLRFAPTKEAIDRAMSKVVGFLVKSGVPEGTAFQLQTIFYEVATNVRRHAQLTSEDSIDFDAQINGQVVTFTFVDNGVSFDPTVHKPDVDLPRANGEFRRRRFGLAMIQRLSDSLQYSRTDSAQNQLRIKKSW
jgi:anti-sigma regulatory factor (Ser/Thr protein kinase)/anti-anti-sigma regulatory factor